MNLTLLFLLFASVWAMDGVDILNTFTKVKKYEVHDFPGLNAIPRRLRPIMYAGVLDTYPVTANVSKTFFWLIRRNQNPNNNLVIWLGGGPGCSSSEAAVNGIGPFRISDNGEITYNNGTWLEDSDLLFVDQPVGTGFSHADDPTTIDYTLMESQLRFWSFYEEFLKVFDAYSNAGIRLAGEGMGAQFAIFYLRNIYSNNVKLSNNKVYLGFLETVFKPVSEYEKNLLESKNSTSGFKITKSFNLKGLIVGNPLISPNYQGSMYADFFYSKKLINDEQYAEVSTYVNACSQALMLDAEDPTTSVYADPVCSELILQKLVEYTKSEDNKTCVDLTDYTKRAEYPFCGTKGANVDNVTKFFRNSTVLKALNMANTNIQWQRCSSDVAANFVNINMTDISTFIKDINVSKLGMVIYNGENDVLCNTDGVEAMLVDSSNWTDNSTTFNQTDYQSLEVNGVQIGEYKKHEYVTLVKLENSTHNVAYSDPLYSRAILKYSLSKYEHKVISGQSQVLNGTKVQAKIVKILDKPPNFSLSSYDLGFVIVLIIGLLSAYGSVFGLKFYFEKN